jgi:peptidoglycan hydrolase-like protein with peptidoglycan-binding domain
MLLVHQGDRGPRVVLLQVLLNRRGVTLQVDGIFGPRTREAVIKFQQQSKPAIPGNGVAAQETWTELLKGGDLRIVAAGGSGSFLANPVL